MPGPAIHHIIAHRVQKKLNQRVGFDFEPALFPFLNFGAQGPDFLFFNTKDIHPALREFVKISFDVQDFIEDFKAKILAIVPKELIELVETLEKVKNDVVRRSAVLSEIEDLIRDSRNLMGILDKSVDTAVKKYITDAFNIFESPLLTHPIQEAHEHNKWWWFDTLHYRRTGQYAEALLRNSKDDKGNHAYAMGYLTHFAADTVGHPYVNIISGGPYRTHPQRHKFVENHHDTYAFGIETNGQDFVQSNLVADYLIEGNADKLPPKLSTLILNCMKEVYHKGNKSQYGTKMDKSDLDDTYRLWLKWFKTTTNNTKLPLPAPYSLTKEMKEAWDKFADNAKDIVNAITNPGNGRSGVINFFKSLAAAILAPFLLAVAVVDYILSNIATLGAAPVRLFISIIYEALYTSFMYFHQGVVLNGLAFPYKSQLNHYLAKHTLSSELKDRLGNNAQSISSRFPTQKFRWEGMTKESHLIYPLSNLEADKSQGAPNSYYGNKPSAMHNNFVNGPFHYINGNIDFNFDTYDWLAHLSEKEEPDGFFEALQHKMAQDNLGNAVDFSCFLYEQFLSGKPIPNFNLDGDRGIGFLCWRKVKQASGINNVAAIDFPVNNEVLNHQTDIIESSSKIL